MPCPFGFKAEEPAVDGADAEDVDDKADKDDRFNYDKDPITWFFQNQIRSEEEFQANKAKLRAEAKRRLENIMAKKNKRIEIDDDDWGSVDSSELSAWDSDVESLSSMHSCANEWAAEARFAAPAGTLLKYSSIASLATVAHAAWEGIKAMSVMRPVSGIVSYAWVPSAMLGVALALLAAAGVCWYATLGRSRRLVLACQLALVLIYGAATVAAVFAYVMPGGVDSEVTHNACARYEGGNHESRLCMMIPAINSQMRTVCSTMWRSAGLVALVALVQLGLCTWFIHELQYVEKKAQKQKRRRRRRKNTINWDKIRVVGPVRGCGGGM